MIDLSRARNGFRVGDRLPIAVCGETYGIIAVLDRVRRGAPTRAPVLPAAEAIVTDEEFRAFVEQHRAFGYGRMMQLISDLWRSNDPRGAFSVGETYGVLENKRERCATKGHDRYATAHHEWCDRCGDRLDGDNK